MGHKATYAAKKTIKNRQVFLKEKLTWKIAQFEDSVTPVTPDVCFAVLI